MDFLLDPIDNNTESPSNTFGDSSLFIEFISRIEGWKTRCKNLHWAAPRKNIHVYLDDFLGILQDYQDALAEETMGIHGQMSPTCISGIAPAASNAWTFIEEVRQGTLKFYASIPEGNIYAGMRSECETFIFNINKYSYLFSLCKGPSQE